MRRPALAALTALTLLAPAPAVAHPAQFRAGDFVVYGFSQSDVGDEDPQVYRLDPDVTIRAIGKWSTAGDEAADYNFAQIERYHARGIAFMGSGTASVIFEKDFPDRATFDDMSTRDAENNPVPHDELGLPEPARRGNIFHPGYREYVLSWARIQIDGGVDGLNFDEVNAGFSGGQKYGFNGNEGFDDHTIADFNRYLLDKYPAFTDADWAARFGMTGDNRIRRDVPPSDLTGNFNYRTYLAAHGWQRDPLNPANPLAAEWGRVVPNRMYADDTSFTATYVRRYWRAMVTEVRAYARARTGKHLLISSNGLWPYVDFTSVGMYPWNPDEQTPDYKGADYMPVVDGHLDGARSLQTQYRYLKQKNREIAGDVPIAVFIDWPNEMMTEYLSLPAEEQKDYWRIFGAEAYANGLFPSFHLKDTVGSPTAEQQGLLGFLTGYARFYRDHGAVFRDNHPAAEAVSVATPGVAVSLLAQRRTGLRTVHLVNHNYDRGAVTQADLPVRADLRSCPRTVTLISPDRPAPARVPFTCRSGALSLTVDRLDHYDVLVLS